MSVLNKLVDQVYVINMDKDVERMKRFDEQMRHHGIEYKRITAIKGTDVSHSKHMTDFCKVYCTDGIKGCALSHHLIWDDMIKHGYSKICVFEDDALLSDTFNEDLPAMWQQLPTTFDLFFMGCNMKCGDTHTISKLIVAVEGTAPPERINTHMLKVGGTVGTHGYVISRHCAELFHSLQFGTHIDFEMGRWIKQYNLEAYSPDPKLVDVTGEDSNLSDTFPPIINTILRDIPISDGASLDWAASENAWKVAGLNINAIIVYLIFMIMFMPSQMYVIFVVWLCLEFSVSMDVKNTFRYSVIVATIIAIKHGIIDHLYPFISKALVK
jgi:GR25 family glycosyltransferase involved in LPS biosynthesis